MFQPDIKVKDLTLSSDFYSGDALFDILKRRHATVKVLDGSKHAIKQLGPFNIAFIQANQAINQRNCTTNDLDNTFQLAYDDMLNAFKLQLINCDLPLADTDIATKKYVSIKFNGIISLVWRVMCVNCENFQMQDVNDKTKRYNLCIQNGKLNAVLI